jgi:hypothetical protein
VNGKQWMATDEDVEMGRNNERRPTRQGVWNVKNIRKQLVQLSVIAGLGFMGLWATPWALADDATPTPIVVEETPAADPAPNATASFAFPTLYVSAPGTGNAGGTGYADEDIMRYQSGTATWSKAFDGSNAGLPDSADIDALTLIINSGYISFLMSFDTPTAVPGLGTVDDSDVARYDTWNGQWSLYLDGSAHGLTTDAEDIDALTFTPGGFLTVSTTGNFAVKALGGGIQKGTDEDLVSLIDAGTHEWTLWLDGTTVGLQGTNDIRAASYLSVNDSLIDDARYLVAQKNFTLPNGTAIGANDVSEQVWFQNGGMEYYKKFDNTTIGFAQIDALEVVK